MTIKLVNFHFIFICQSCFIWDVIVHLGWVSLARIFQAISLNAQPGGPLLYFLPLFISNTISKNLTSLMKKAIYIFEYALQQDSLLWVWQKIVVQKYLVCVFIDGFWVLNTCLKLKEGSSTIFLSWFSSRGKISLLQ